MGIRQLRDTLTETMRRVREGETVEVTHHGVPVAVITPISANRVGRLVGAGEVRAATSPRRPIRRFPMTGELTASQAIEDDRAER